MWLILSCNLIWLVVPVPRISLQPSGFLQGVVGEMQDIICSVIITAAIDSNSVELTWTNNDSIITADNRVTITPTNITENPSSFTYSTTIRFTDLMEGDEGNYTCNVTVDDMMESHSITLQKLKSTYVYTINVYVATNLLEFDIIHVNFIFHSTQPCC